MGPARELPGLLFVPCLIAWSVVISGPAQAVDGATEINQVRALEGGVGSTDAAGFPVSISDAGSYVLTGSLTVDSANATAIEITVPDVTLDLRGFVVQGPIVCAGSGAGLTCGAGTGVGVLATQPGITLRGGIVRGFGGGGVDVGDECRVDGVSAAENGSFGIRAGDNCALLGSTAVRNEGPGIQGSQGALVFQGTAEGNLAGGVQCAAACAVVETVTEGNGASGIEAGAGALVRGSAASANGNDGIRTDVGSLVDSNTSNENLNFAVASPAPPVTPCTQPSSCYGFTNNVILTDPSNLGMQGGKTVDNGGVEMPPNTCDGNVTCP